MSGGELGSVSSAGTVEDASEGDGFGEDIVRMHIHTRCIGVRNSPLFLHDI